MKELRQYKRKVQEAEAFLAENCWVGVIYSGTNSYDQVDTFEFDEDMYKCRAAAPKKLTAKEIFCDITENSNGSQFYMESPCGDKVGHISFIFKCTIRTVRYKYDGSVEIKTTDFEGTYRDLKLSREDTLHNVEVIE